MDAGLAKVINSTIGTGNFKPLDKVFADNIKLVASEEVMYTYDGTFTFKSQDSYNHGAITADKYITINTPGAVYIKTTQTVYKAGSNGTPTSVQLQVLDESGSIINSDSAGGTSSDGTIVEIFVPINVVSGKKYKIKMTAAGGNNSTPAYNFSVCGKTVFFGATVTSST